MPINPILFLKITFDIKSTANANNAPENEKIKEVTPVNRREVKRTLAAETAAPALYEIL